MVTMTRTHESSAPTACLLMAFELGQRSWKLGFSVGMGQRPRIRQIPAGAVGVLGNEIARAKARVGLSAEAAVISCYEAGRDGFWLHRYLLASFCRETRKSLLDRCLTVSLDMHVCYMSHIHRHAT
jgi:hypothetical protein